MSTQNTQNIQNKSKEKLLDSWEEWCESDEAVAAEEVVSEEVVSEEKVSINSDEEWSDDGENPDAWGNFAEESNDDEENLNAWGNFAEDEWDQGSQMVSNDLAATAEEAGAEKAGAEKAVAEETVAEEAGAEKVGAEKVGWDCSACTFINVNFTRYCEICSTSRKLAKALAEKAAAEKAAAAETATENLHPWWACNICTFQNPHEASICGVCNSPRGTTADIINQKAAVAIKKAEAEKAADKQFEDDTLLALEVSLKAAMPFRTPWPCKLCPQENKFYEKNCGACAAPQGMVAKRPTNEQPPCCSNMSGDNFPHESLFSPNRTKRGGDPLDYIIPTTFNF
jgi:hypothetical protein